MTNFQKQGSSNKRVYILAHKLQMAQGCVELVHVVQGCVLLLAHRRVVGNVV